MGTYPFEHKARRAAQGGWARAEGSWAPRLGRWAQACARHGRARVGAPAPGHAREHRGMHAGAGRAALCLRYGVGVPATRPAGAYDKALGWPRHDHAHSAWARLVRTGRARLGAWCTCEGT